MFVPLAPQIKCLESIDRLRGVFLINNGPSIQTAFCSQSVWLDRLSKDWRFKPLVEHWCRISIPVRLLRIGPLAIAFSAAFFWLYHPFERRPCRSRGPWLRWQTHRLGRRPNWFDSRKVYAKLRPTVFLILERPLLSGETDTQKFSFHAGIFETFMLTCSQGGVQLLCRFTKVVSHRSSELACLLRIDGLI